MMEVTINSVCTYVCNAGWAVHKDPDLELLEKLLKKWFESLGPIGQGFLIAGVIISLIFIIIDSVRKWRKRNNGNNDLFIF